MHLFTNQINRIRKNKPLILLLLLVSMQIAAQTTGKISGKVLDKKDGSPLIGVNIIVEGYNFGAATDANGEYFIINIPPNNYNLKASLIGYETIKIENVTVSVNRTSNVNFRMSATIIEGEEVVIVAEKISNKKDQTSSVRNINADQINSLPVENVESVVEMQAGVVAGHFRGGRIDEVAYLVDGLNVNDASYRTRAVTIEKDVVSEVEVITGTFNAEYGNAMSGIVNIVTKDGGDQIHASASVNSSNFYTSHKDIFIGLKDSDFFRTKDYQLYLELPIISNVLSIVTNGRYQDIKDQFNGIKRFLPDNYSNFLNENPDQWYSEHTGDNSITPMGVEQSFSLFGKLFFKPFTSIRSSLIYSLNHSESKWYGHYWKYNPDGRGTNHFRTDLVALEINHTLSSALFYELKFSYLRNFTGTYVYEDYLDSRYVHDIYSESTGSGFSTGGQDKNYSKRTNQDYSAKFDITYQADKNHILKSGILFTKHNLDNFWAVIRNKYAGTPEELEFTIDTASQKRIYTYYEPTLITNSSVYSDIYTVSPVEFAAYIQDKMEYDNLVINLGARYDYFNPNATYPSQLRNPANQLSFPDNPEYMSKDLKADPSYQISPRFGISYQLGKAALLRFSYGHFFQMPPLYALYTNPQHIVSAQDYGTTMGFAQIKPQKTIQYEVGLWQQLTNEMGLEVAVFYRDIYDLLSAKVITTFNQIRYGLYSNKDYGNARGLELKFDFVSGNLSAGLNYTLQFTRGNADNPTFTFSRAGSNIDPVNVLIPMSWDQRHTLNVSVSYFSDFYGASLIAYYNSGTPYTWTPLVESRLYQVNLNPNNSPKPATFSVDLSAFYTIWQYDKFSLKVNLLAYNIFDTLNEVNVYSSTGQAYTDIVLPTNISSHRSDFNDYYDVIHDPSMYSAPRSIKLGLTFSF
ncbi:MAG: TonB-dependent receptor [Ignavibacteriaceae bacterium]|nr:TonB-dependent receptor [Ignavibacteriaceae bacterium]